MDVVSEANNFRQGWGGWIFASASEMVGREKIKDVLSGIEKVRVDEGESGRRQCGRSIGLAYMLGLDWGVCNER